MRGASGKSRGKFGCSSAGPSTLTAQLPKSSAGLSKREPNGTRDWDRVVGSPLVTLKPFASDQEEQK